MHRGYNIGISQPFREGGGSRFEHTERASPRGNKSGGIEIHPCMHVQFFVAVTVNGQPFWAMDPNVKCQMSKEKATGPNKTYCQRKNLILFFFKGQC